MEYRCEAANVTGFIQQLAVAYVTRGYFYYVLGQVPEGKDPRHVDEKLVRKYGIEMNKGARCRRKALGYANLQYVRYKRSFVLLATEGKHEFFQSEAGQVRDVREMPIKLFGYSVSHRNGRTCVRIEQRLYLGLKARMAEQSVHRPLPWFQSAFRSFGFEPYAPVRSQLHCILRAVNRRRKVAQLELVPSTSIRTVRKIVSPFEEARSVP
ncbi:hypothetical protein F183_A21260 [Bryobacterales bacterium F-183]|nr:hypothetical protein F183_A21260 [Bryobacterales bacterium F-183]